MFRPINVLNLKQMENKIKCPYCDWEDQSGEEFLEDIEAMPRYFLDERIGCIAIRDTNHPKFDINHQGLDPELQDVVKFHMGKVVSGEWVIPSQIIAQFKYECALLNKP